MCSGLPLEQGLVDQATELMSKPLWAKEFRSVGKRPLQSRAYPRNGGIAFEPWSLQTRVAAAPSSRPYSTKLPAGQAFACHPRAPAEAARAGSAGRLTPLASTDGFSSRSCATASSKRCVQFADSRCSHSLVQLPVLTDQRGASATLFFDELYALARSRAVAKTKSKQHKDVRSLPGVKSAAATGATAGTSQPQQQSAESGDGSVVKLAPVPHSHDSCMQSTPDSAATKADCGYLDVASTQMENEPRNSCCSSSSALSDCWSSPHSRRRSSISTPEDKAGVEAKRAAPRKEVHIGESTVIIHSCDGPLKQENHCTKHRSRSSAIEALRLQDGVRAFELPHEDMKGESVAEWREQTRTRRKTLMATGWEQHQAAATSQLSLRAPALPSPQRADRDGPRRTIKEVLQEHMAKPGSFSKEELRRMQAGFMRFRGEESHEVDKEVLHEVFTYLGYLRVTKEQVSRLADEVTPYATLDFEEFVLVAEKYSFHEFTEFKVLFDSVDLDANGELETDEIILMMKQLGITPLQKVVQEALEVVDDNDDGKINFEEFVHLMAVYRVTEGFSAREVEELKGVFNHFAARAPAPGTSGSNPAERQLRTTCLTEAMLHMFGPQAMTLALKLSLQLQGMGPAPENQGLNFSEFLVWARILREKELAEYKRQFAEFQKSGEKTVAWEEIGQILQAYGYMPLRETLHDLQDALDLDADQKMDFDEFVELMATFRRNDGFTREEASRLKRLFERFDADRSGELESLELLDIMRHLGFTTTVIEARKLVGEVDFNNSGALDFREFLRLMRISRERELTSLQRIFKAHADLPGGLLSCAKLEQALRDAGRAWEESILIPVVQVATGHDNDKESFDFDTFVALADQCRSESTRTRRKWCAFSAEEVNRFKDAFNEFDPEAHGYIDHRSLATLLRDMGVQLNTRDDQQQIMKQIAVAKVKVQDVAREVDSRPTSQDQSEETPEDYVNFWDFVQLMRMLYDGLDMKEEKHEEKLREFTGFMPKEVEDFRQIFSNWCSIEARLGPSMQKAVAKQWSDPHQVALKPAYRRSQLLHRVPKQQRTVGPNDLSQAVLHRLLKSIGIELSPDTQRTLSTRIHMINEQAAYHHNIGDAHDIQYAADPERVNFDTFLQLMRWMLDSNFAAMNDILVYGSIQRARAAAAAAAAAASTK